MRTGSPSADTRQQPAALRRLPEIYRARAAAEYGRIAATEGAAAARRWLDWLTADLPTAKLMDAGEQQLAERARRYSLVPARTAANDAALTAAGLDRAAAWTWRNMPADARPSDERWWRRHLRETKRRGREAAAIRLGVVGEPGHLYATADAVAARAAQTQRQIDWMRGTQLTDGDKTVSVYDAWKSSVANPRNRAAELAVRAYGLCDEEGDTGREPRFVTVTVPARFHRRRLVNRRTWETALNPNWDGTLPDAAHAWFQSRWVAMQQDQRWRGLNVRGLLAAEPHQDGAPHYHSTLYSNNPALLERLLRIYFLEGEGCYGDESGAAQHRVQCLPVRPTPRDFQGSRADFVRRSAVKYLTKYITKHTTGLTDYDGETPTVSAHVDAWRATWNIRAYRFIGQCGVTLWRELRRYAALGETGEVIPEPISNAIMAAAANDWRSFAEAVRDCGLTATTAEEMLSDQRQQPEVLGAELTAALTARVEAEGGEIGVVAVNESPLERVAPGRIVGVRTAAGESLLTRAAYWRIAPPSTVIPAVAACRAGAGAEPQPPTWSNRNNFGGASAGFDLDGPEYADFRAALERPTARATALEPHLFTTTPADQDVAGQDAPAVPAPRARSEARAAVAETARELAVLAWGGNPEYAELRAVLKRPAAPPQVPAGRVTLNPSRLMNRRAAVSAHPWDHTSEIAELFDCARSYVRVPATVPARHDEAQAAAAAVVRALAAVGVAVEVRPSAPPFSDTPLTLIAA